MVAEPLQARVLEALVAAARISDPAVRLVWELRGVGRRDHEGRLRIALDGGARVEPASAAAGSGDAPILRASYRVGVGPFGLVRLCQGRDDHLGERREWTATRDLAVAAVERLLEDAEARLGRLGVIAAPVSGLRRATAAEAAAAVHVRWRGCVAGDCAPLCDVGFGTILEVSAARCPPRGRSWLLPPAGAGRDDLGIPPAALAGGEASRPALAGEPVRLTAWAGRVVLEPEVAGWWAHELAHAALESDAGWSGVEGDLRLIEDPSRGSWPIGCAADDHGDRCRPQVLLGSGATPAERHGLHRRASVRDPALPVPVCTRLEPACGTTSALPEASAAVPRVYTAAGARLDPVAPAIVVAIPAGGLRVGAEGRPVADEGVLVVDLLEGWRGARAVRSTSAGDAGIWEEVALCTRLGQSHPAVWGAGPAVEVEARWFPVAAGWQADGWTR